MWLYALLEVISPRNRSGSSNLAATTFGLLFILLMFPIWLICYPLGGGLPRDR